VKALTVWQPSAWAICAGYKDVENRTQPTRFRGRVLIHAARGTDSAEFVEWVEEQTGERPELVNSAIIGYATIVDCTLYPTRGLFRRNSPKAALSAWASEYAGGGPGTYQWHLRDAGFLEEPIPHRGQLGFWTPKGEINVDPQITGGSGG
jgi:hypothetical protein